MTIVESGWNLWYGLQKTGVELWMESMGVPSGWGCKEVKVLYIFSKY